MASDVTKQMQDENAMGARTPESRAARRAAEEAKRAERKAAFDARFPKGVLGPDMGRGAQRMPSGYDSPVDEVSMDEDRLASIQTTAADQWKQEVMPRLMVIAMENGMTGQLAFERELGKAGVSLEERRVIMQQYEQELRRSPEERRERMREYSESLIGRMTLARMPVVIRGVQEQREALRLRTKDSPTVPEGQFADGYFPASQNAGGADGPSSVGRRGESEVLDRLFEPLGEFDPWRWPHGTARSTASDRANDALGRAWELRQRQRQAATNTLRANRSLEAKEEKRRRANPEDGVPYSDAVRFALPYDEAQRQSDEAAAWAAGSRDRYLDARNAEWAAEREASFTSGGGSRPRESKPNRSGRAAWRLWGLLGGKAPAHVWQGSENRRALTPGDMRTGPGIMPR